MVDLTIVTCLVPALVGTDDVDAAAHLAEPLLEAGVPLVVYVEEPWKDALRARYPHDTTHFRETTAPRRAASFSHIDALLTARAKTAAAAQRPPDYFVATLTKMGMLHDQSIWNPFGTRYLAWMDADAPASMSPQYFRSARVLELLPALLQRFLFLARPGAVTDAAGVSGASRVQGQLFGGEAAQIAPVNALYYQLLEQWLRRGDLPSDEAIFTQMVASDAARFDRVVLQDNGLLGFLFEEMRSGRVRLERTAIH